MGQPNENVDDTAPLTAEDYEVPADAADENEAPAEGDEPAEPAL